MTRSDINYILLSHHISKFEIFEGINCNVGAVIIFIYQWVWWWNRKKVRRSIEQKKPIGIKMSVVFVFMHKSYSN
jgi:hypothetical protein